MPDNNSHPSPPTTSGQPQRKRVTWPLLIVAVLFIVVPFLAWYGTWFGRDLSDEKITEYLSDQSKPRHVQHALVQLVSRLEAKDASARRWYPQIVALADSNVLELRSNVAWLMGKDNQSQEFHTALQKLVHDPEPLVQRNAALSLVTFNDPAGLNVLRSMLQPYAVVAPTSGVVDSVLKEGLPARPGMMLGQIKQSDGLVAEVRSPLPGEINRVLIPTGSQIAKGDQLLLLSPDADTVWETLRALYLFGQPEDLEAVERYAQGVDKMPDQIKEQAVQTAKAIRDRSAKN
jgi:hypothetical protein